MTLCTNFYPMDNKEGVDLNQPQAISVSTEPSYPAPSAKLGDAVKSNNGGEWVFVQASATVTQNNLVAIDSSFQARNMTPTLAASNRYVYGIAQFQATLAGPGDFFWAALKIAAGGQLNFASTALQGAKIFVSGTAGLVTTGVTTTIPQIVGIAFCTTITGSTAANEIVGQAFMTPYVSV